MATVYLSRLSGLAGFEKLVAVKVIHPHLAAKHDFVEMFLDEARLSAKIHHPNVVEIHDVGEADGQYFMVAELVQGQSLHNVIRAFRRLNRPFDPSLGITIAARVCDALQVAHNLKAADGTPLNLVHRDISPGNILISYNGIVKLIDFGIAFSKGRMSETESGVVKGKLDYMAPEQLRRKAVDGRSDIFSLGVVLYQLATGHHPFMGIDEGEMLERRIKGRPIPPREVLPDIEPSLEKTIIKALSEDPENRQQTARELGLELRDLLVPKGALLDQQNIAEFMSALFAQQIIEDNEIFDQASLSYPSNPEDEERKPKNTRSGDGRVTGEKCLESEVKAYTEVLTPAFEEPENPRSLHRGGVALLVLTGCLVAFFSAWALRDNLPAQHTQILEAFNGEATTGDSADPALNSEAPNSEAPNSEAPNSEAPNSKRIEPEEPPAVVPSTVQILLRGAPASAEVTLDGAKATLVANRLTVPVDGEERVLRITAQGYEPYVHKIKPHADGEMTVELKKIGGQLPKRSHTRKEDQKNEPKNTLQTCPYCK
jgi:serine/threonine protein kinase